MNFKQAYTKYSSLWNNEFRFYHNVENHLKPMISKISKNYHNDIRLKYFALFHDIIYDPYSETNVVLGF